MRSFPYYIFVLSISLSGEVHAENAWLKLSHMANQARHLSFTGQYVRQTDDQPMQSFTVYRMVKHRDTITRQVAMNGDPHELIKTPDKIQFFATNKMGLLQAKMDSVRIVPTLLPQSINLLQNNYILVHKKYDRVAACQCQWWWLIPKNTNLYTQGFCLAKRTGLPLVHIYKTANNIAEQNSFTHLSFRVPTDANMQPDKQLKQQASMTLPVPKTSGSLNSDNLIHSLPDGFFIMNQRYITMPDGTHGQHYMLSDGLVKVSLFIEKVPASTANSVNAKTISGALSMGSKINNGIHLVAIGDIPPDGLIHLMDNIRINHN